MTVNIGYSSAFAIVAGFTFLSPEGFQEKKNIRAALYAKEPTVMHKTSQSRIATVILYPGSSAAQQCTDYRSLGVPRAAPPAPVRKQNTEEYSRYRSNKFKPQK